jgi:hypothetical protein
MNTHPDVTRIILLSSGIDSVSISRELGPVLSCLSCDRQSGRRWVTSSTDGILIDPHPDPYRYPYHHITFAEVT